MTCFRLKSGVSLSSHCKRRGLSYYMCYHRVEKGMTPDEAVEAVKKWKGSKTSLNNCRHFLSNGESLRSVCIREGVKQGRCYELMKTRGISPDEAFKIAKEEIQSRIEFKKFVIGQGLPETVTKKDYEILKYLKDVDKPVYVTEISSFLRTRRSSDIWHSVVSLRKRKLVECFYEKKGLLKKGLVCLSIKAKKVFKDG